MVKASDYCRSEWMKPSDLEGGQEKLSIERVEERKFDGEPRPKLVIYFVNKAQPLVCNKTNTKKLIEILGDDTDDWAGKSVILYETEVSFQGKTGPAIRIRAVKQTAPKSSRGLEGDDIPF